MQINRSQGTTSFKGTIPVRVFIDGMETFQEAPIKNAARQLTTILAGPLHGNEQGLHIARKLAGVDPDYNINRAIHGFKLPEKWKKATPSDFFRLLKSDDGKFILLTGHQGEQMANLGKALGIARGEAKERNCSNSFDVIVAKRNYESYMKNCLKNLKLRITEIFNRNTKQKIGAPIELNIHMTSNKKYGKSTFKMKLSDISFSKE